MSVLTMMSGAPKRKKHESEKHYRLRKYVWMCETNVQSFKQLRKEGQERLRRLEEKEDAYG